MVWAESWDGRVPRDRLVPSLLGPGQPDWKCNACGINLDHEFLKPHDSLCPVLDDDAPWEE